MHSTHIRQSTLFFKKIILELILMVKIESINFLLKKNKKIGTSVLTLPKLVIYYKCNWQTTRKSANKKKGRIKYVYF